MLLKKEKDNVKNTVNQHTVSNSRNVKFAKKSTVNLIFRGVEYKGSSNKYMVVESRLADKSNEKLVSSSSLSVSKDIYTIPSKNALPAYIVEEFFAIIESDMGSTISSVSKNQKFFLRDKMAIIAYVLAQNVRTISHKDNLDSFRANVIEMAKSVNEAIKDEEINNQLDLTLGSSIFGEVILTSFGAKFANFISMRQFTWYTVPSGTLFTMSPLSYFSNNPEELNLKTLLRAESILLPLERNLVLAMNYPPLVKKEENSFIVADNNVSLFLNKVIALQVGIGGLIYHHPDDLPLKKGCPFSALALAFFGRDLAYDLLKEKKK